jgi:hypothetical protein
MRERRYTDEQVAAIFEQAAETDHAALPVPAAGKGMTLATLQEIGREVGISPESISHAARSLDLVGRPAGSLGNSGSVVGVGFMASLGLGMFAVGALQLPGWARLRRTQIEAVTARLVIAAGTPQDDRKPERD